MLVSVIVPTYKRPQIFECLRALFSQKNFTDFEVIVVVRNPEDTFWLAVESFRQSTFKTHLDEQRLRFVEYNEPGNGPAKNYAVRFANGKYIAFTDDDCLVSEYWLYILTMPVLVEADIVIGQCLPYDAKNPYLVAHQGAIMYHLDKNPVNAPGAMIGTTMNLLIRKSTFEKLGGFDPVFARHYGDDFDFNQKWASDTKLVVVYYPSAFVWHNHKLTFKKLYKLSFRMGMGAKKCEELMLKRIQKRLDELESGVPISTFAKDIIVHPMRNEYGAMMDYINTTPFLISSERIKRRAAVLAMCMQEVRRLGYRYAAWFPKRVSKVYD